MYSLKEQCEGWNGEIHLDKDPNFTENEQVICQGFFHLVGDLLTSISKLPPNETRQRLTEFVGAGVTIFKENLLENLSEFMAEESWNLPNENIQKIFGTDLANQLFDHLASKEEKEQIVPILPPYITARHLQEEEEDFFNFREDDDDEPELLE